MSSTTTETEYAYRWQLTAHRSGGRVSLYAPFARDGERRGVIRAELFPEGD